MKLHWIDDEEELLEILEFMLEQIGITGCKFHERFEHCEPEEGDVVIHDLLGIGEKKYQKNIIYIVCSGSMAEKDLPSINIGKPFDCESIREALKREGVYDLLVDNSD